MKLISKKFYSGATLIELILAMILVGVVIMTGLSMELGLRRIYSSADMEAQLLADAAPIMQTVVKAINMGIGSPASSPYSNPSVGVYRIYYDSNSNGRRDAGDTAVQFTYLGASNILMYRKTLTSGDLLLSNRIVGFGITAPSNGVSNITIQVRNVPGAAAGYTNPEVTITSSAQYRAYSYH